MPTRSLLPPLRGTSLIRGRHVLTLTVRTANKPADADGEEQGVGKIEQDGEGVDELKRVCK